MAVIPPRRDEIALSKGGFLSQRMITYLEDITQTTNIISNNITEINEIIIGELSQSNANSLIDNTIKDVQNINNLVAGLTSDLGFLIAENKNFRDNFSDLINITMELKSDLSSLISDSDKFKKEISDLQQLHAGGI